VIKAKVKNSNHNNKKHSLNLGANKCSMMNAPLTKKLSSKYPKEYYDLWTGEIEAPLQMNIFKSNK
jgi:hypothetical protein